MELETKVTCINGRWHARLLKGDTIYDEMACDLRSDISFICREMLRWYDKLGGVSKMASASRHRSKNKHTAIGKIWYRKNLI